MQRTEQHTSARRQTLTLDEKDIRCACGKLVARWEPRGLSIKKGRLVPKYTPRLGQFILPWQSAKTRTPRDELPGRREARKNAPYRRVGQSSEHAPIAQRGREKFATG